MQCDLILNAKREALERQYRFRSIASAITVGHLACLRQHLCMHSSKCGIYVSISGIQDCKFRISASDCHAGLRNDDGAVLHKGRCPKPGVHNPYMHVIALFSNTSILHGLPQYEWHIYPLYACQDTCCPL